ncbi:MAG TPA: sigma factor-like helix-turn-helix DNA-binding protein [Solirubrobacteraceae bacterium]|nr:sigma factor-like helix-turn-helix DNA-binding protein [Solirubrobacteraceae bacterium]
MTREVAERTLARLHEAQASFYAGGPREPLHEVLTDEGAGDPSVHAELADSLSLAFLVLLERLSPVERAAFLLREVFAYPYDEIAEVIGKSEANARQLVSRARRHVDAERPRFDVDRQAHEELTDRFIEATQNGDTEGLIELLAEDVYTYTDGGGKAQAPRRTVHGPEHVARFMVGISRPGRGADAVTLHPVLVNGVPGRLARDAEGNAVAVLTLDVADGLVTAVRIVVNPDKLTHLQAS